MKKISLLIIALVVSLCSITTTYADEAPEEIDETPMTFLIKVDTGHPKKGYKVHINDSTWFKHWTTDKSQMSEQHKSKSRFIKPSFIEKK